MNRKIQVSRKYTAILGQGARVSFRTGSTCHLTNVRSIISSKPNTNFQKSFKISFHAQTSEGSDRLPVHMCFP